MQTVWARVAQTRSSCHCPSCVSPTQAINRRSTTAAPRRRLRFRDVCTAFYSAALATAAVVDGNFKETRRRDLDKSIDQAKGELEALKEVQHKRLQALSIATNNADIREGRIRDCWAKVFQWEAEERRCRVAFGFQDLKGIPLSTLGRITEKELDELRSQPRDERGLWGREPHDQPLSRKRMKLLEWSVAKMVLKMFHHTAKYSMSQDVLSIEESPASSPHSTDFSVELEAMQGHICNLQNTSSNSGNITQIESPRLPRYITTQPVNPENVISLNQSIRHAFHSTKGTIPKGILDNHPRIESLIAKICYSLLTSSTAPNVHTYNLLLFHLLRLKEYDLVRLAIDSIAESCLRPNELTTHLILKFYRAVRDREGFLSYEGRMRGKNCGLALAHPCIKMTVMNERHYKYRSQFVRYVKDEKHKKLVFNGIGGPDNKIIELAHRNQEGFDQLIKGALEFCGQEKAMKFYRAMIEGGWEPDGTLLGCILKHCWKTLDWPTTELLWQRLTNLGTDKIKELFPVILSACVAHDQRHKYYEIRKIGWRRGWVSLSKDLPSFADAKFFAGMKGQDSIRQLELRMEFIGWKICYTAKNLANVKETLLQDSTVEKRIHANMKELNKCLAVGLENTIVMQDIATVPVIESNAERRLSQNFCNVYPPLPELPSNDEPSPEPAIQKPAQSDQPKPPLVDFQPSSFGETPEEAYRYPTLTMGDHSMTDPELDTQ